MAHFASLYGFRSNANMKKLLFIDGCVRNESRTRALAEEYLKSIDGKYDIHIERISDIDITPLNSQTLAVRDENCLSGNLNGKYALAHEFALADCIVMAAPYWDCLMPSKLKVYIENICVSGITLAYGDEGHPRKLCRADSMVYITTAGGFLPKHSALEGFVRELGGMLCIPDIHFFCAQGLDVFPDKVEDMLDGTLKEMLEKAKL